MDAEYQRYLASVSSAPPVPRGATGAPMGHQDPEYQRYLSGAPLNPLESLIVGRNPNAAPKPPAGGGVNVIPGLGTFPSRPNITPTVGFPGRKMHGFWDTVFNPTEAIPGIGPLSTAYKAGPGATMVKKTDIVNNQMLSDMGLNTSSVPLNFASRIPAAALATGTSLLADTVKQAPDMLALGGIGKLARLGNVWGGVQSAVGSILPDFMKFRGGLTPESLQQMATFDRAILENHEASVKTAESLLYAKGTRKLSVEEQRFLGTLLEQPHMREYLSGLNASQFPANRAALAAEAVPVPGRASTAGYAGRWPTAAPLIPAELSQSPKQFAQVAEEVAGQLGQAKQKMMDLGIADPDAFARFNELNYNPIMYTMKRQGILPTMRSLLREPSKGFMKMRQEMTDEMRGTLGQVLEPAGPVSIRLAQEGRAIATRELFQAFSANPNIIRAAADAKEMMAETGAKSADGFVKMASSANLGPLAGQWMRAQEAREVNAMVQTESSAMRLWKDIFMGWRFGKTVLNPATHVNNFTSNVMLADAAGLSPYRMDIYAKAANAMRNPEKGWWAEAKTGGAPWTMGGNTQLAGDILDVQRSVAQQATNMYEHFGRTFAKAITGNPVSRAAGDIYQGSEALFKQAIYILKRREGQGVSDAIKAAQDAIFNYDEVPLWVKQARTKYVPFVTFTYKVIPQIAQAAVEHPEVFLRWKIFYNTWNRLAAESAGITPALQADINTQFTDGFPLLSPFRSADGSPIVYNVARKTPIQDVLPTPGMGDSLLGLPAQLLLKNPMAGETLSQAMGKDIRTGATFGPAAGQVGQGIAGASAAGVSPKDMNEIERYISAGSGRMAHAARTFLPEIAGGGSTQNVVNAMQGRTNYLGEQTPVPRALAEVFAGKGQSLAARTAQNQFSALQLRDLARLMARHAARAQGAK